MKVKFKKGAPQGFKGWGSEDTITEAQYNNLKDLDMYEIEVVETDKKKTTKKK